MENPDGDSILRKTKAASGSKMVRVFQLGIHCSPYYSHIPSSFPLLSFLDRSTYTAVPHTHQPVSHSGSMRGPSPFHLLPHPGLSSPSHLPEAARLALTCAPRGPLEALSVVPYYVFQIPARLFKVELHLSFPTCHTRTN